MGSFWFQLAAIIALLAANAFFVAAEFALVSARDFRIEPQARAGRRSARLAMQIKGNIDPYLAACQLGITMASLGLGWLGEPAVAALLEPVLHPMGFSDTTVHTIAFLVGFIVFSSLHIVVGEQVPKTIAIRKAEAASMLVAYPLRWFFLLIYPLNWVLNATSGAILRGLGVRAASHAEVLTSDELRGLIRLSASHGEVDAERAQMLHNLFRFDERTVSRVMIPRTEAQTLQTTASAARNLGVIRATHYSRFPLIGDETDNLLGVVLVRDLVDAMIDGTSTPWDNLETYCREPLIVPETLSVSDLFEMMRTSRSHMACVIDEYGSFVGLITMEDLLEEIVGEIADETDKREQNFPVVWKDDHWEAHGLAPLSDLEHQTTFRADSGIKANTVSGLIMTILARLPEDGDELECNGYRFTVMGVHNRRAAMVRVEALEAEENADPDATAVLPVGENGSLCPPDTKDHK